MDSTAEEQGEGHEYLDKPEKRENTRGFGIAVAASVVLHLSVMVAIASAGFGKTVPAPPVTELPAIKVTLRQLQPRTPEPVEDTATTARTESATSQRTESRKLPATPPTIATNPKPASPASSAPDETAVTLPAMDEAEVSQMISSYMRTYRSSEPADWSDPCKRYRDPLVSNDCPQQTPDRGTRQLEIAKSTAETFTDYISGHDRNQRAIQTLAKEMDRLRPLMASNPVMAKMASEKYYEAEKQYLYLGGPTSNKNFLMSMVDRANADSVSLFSFSVPLSLGGLITLAKTLSGREPPVMAKPYSPPTKPVSPPAPVSDIPAFKLKPAPLGTVNKAVSD